MMLMAWSSTINPGTVVALVLAAIAGWFAIKGKQASAADERAKRAEQSMRDFRDNYTAEHERCESLEKQVLEQRELKHSALTEVARLRLITDNEQVLRAISDLRAEVAEQFRQFVLALDSFKSSQEAQTSVLQQIAANLKNLNKQEASK